MVGHVPLEHAIGVRIPGGQPHSRFIIHSNRQLTKSSLRTQRRLFLASKALPVSTPVGSKLLRCLYNLFGAAVLPRVQRETLFGGTFP